MKIPLRPPVLSCDAWPYVASAGRRTGGVRESPDLHTRWSEACRLVELMGRYSNQAHLMETNKRAVSTSATRRQAAEVTWRSFRLADRIPEQLRQEIIRSYETGESAHALGARHGIARNSILALVAEAGVPRKVRRMSEAETDDAVALYQRGLSFVLVGERLGFGPTAIADALKRRGESPRSRRSSEFQSKRS